MHRNHGIIYFTDSLDAKALEAFALRLEELGYESLWVPEFLGREPYATVSFLLARTSRLKIASGIANVYSHDAIVAAQTRQTLAELSGGRFIMGLGVSHPQMADLHGLEWVPPVRKMRAYLDTMEATQVASPEPSEPAPIWLAAHGPLLLKLAAARVAAANVYLMPPAHTARAREIVGPGFRLNVVLPCVLTDDEERARKIGRRAISIYLPLPAYQRQWLSWGFEPSDFEDGGSDKLVDSVIAWGDETKIRARMQEYLDAGGSQIQISALNPEGRGADWKLYEAFAPEAA